MFGKFKRNWLYFEWKIQNWEISCTKAIDNYKKEYELKYEEYATGKSHCKSLSSNLTNLLNWFDKHSFSIDATTATPATIAETSIDFKRNLNLLFEFEDHKEHMINEWVLPIKQNKFIPNYKFNCESTRKYLI